MDNRKWQQKDGTWISLRDMTKKHLENTINLLRRKRTVATLVDTDEHSGEVVYGNDEEMINAMESELYRRKVNPDFNK